MSRRFSLLTLVVVGLCAAPALAEVAVTYKHDQFSENIQTAGTQISGIPLATQPGFVAGEAFGQLYTPSPNAYPVKIQGVDLVMAAPPNGGTGKAHAQIEIYFHPGGADPGKTVPDFKLSTHDVFNPMTSDFGMPIQGNAAMQFDFDWEDAEGHPPVLTEGSFTVMVRFLEQANDLTDEWGSFQCTKMAELGMCGCQQVGTVNDQATTSQANVLHIIYPPGNCSGQASGWKFAEAVGVTGDFILRVRALANEGVCTPDCLGKECGSNGCGGSCGQCAGGTVCQSGKCVDDSCTPECGGKECGDDGCEGSCGECDEGQECVDGKCSGGGCDSKCAGKECGDDGCGGVCGLCAEGAACVQGLCEGGGGGGGGEVTVTAISPSFAFNDEDEEVSITGSGFAPGATVKLGATFLSAVMVVTPQLISARVPAGMTAGRYMLIVVNSDGGTATLPDAFEVKEAEAGASDGGCGVGDRPAALPAALLLLVVVLGLVRRHRSGFVR